MIKKIDQIKDLLIVPSVDEQPRLAINQMKILNLLIELRAEAEQCNIANVVVSETELCDNPHCEDGIADRDMYGHPIYCQVCDKHN